MLTAEATVEGLIRLTRNAQERGEDGEKWLEVVLEKNLSKMALIAVEVAVETGDPVGQVLARVLARREAPRLGARLLSRCDQVGYRYVVALRELALEAMRQVVSVRQQIPRQSVWEEALDGLLLNNLSSRLRDVGDTEKAAEVSSAVVKRFELLAHKDSETFGPDLVRALLSQAAVLGALGDREDALGVARRAVDLARSDGFGSPVHRRQVLASSLNNLGTALSRQGDLDGAIEVLEEAVSMWRLELDSAVQCEQRVSNDREEADGRELLRQLAGSLHSFGDVLSRKGLWPDAAEVLKEAVGRRRTLAEKQPEAFEPELAQSLAHYSQALVALGDIEPARRLAEDAVRFYQALYARRPNVFGSDLAKSLVNLGNLYAELGEIENSRENLEEAVELFRKLAARRRDVPRADFGRAVLDLAAVLIEAEQWRAAVDAAGEAVDVFHLLTTDGHPSYQRELASSYANFSAAHIGLKDWEKAVDAARKSTALFLRLRRSDPEIAGPGLVTSLSDLALARRGLGRGSAALAAVRRAIKVCEEFGDVRPYLDLKAHALDIVGLLLDETGQRQKSVEVSRKAVDIRRLLVEKGGVMETQALAALLINHADRLRASGKPEEASRWLEEADQLLRSLRLDELRDRERARSRELRGLLAEECRSTSGQTG